MFEKRAARESIFGGVPEDVHARLEQTLSSIQEEESMKKMRWQPVIILLILLILCGAAVAAVMSWDVRSALTRQNGQGEQIVNEELVQLAQDVRQTFTGEYLRVTVADALFDGRSLAAAWTLENLSGDQLVYVIATETEDSVRWDGPGGFGGTEEFLRPGEIRNGNMDHEISEPIQGDTLRVGIRYFVLAPAVEMAYIQFPDWHEEGYMKKIDAMEAEAKALSDEGKLAIIADKSTSAYGGEWLSLSSAFHEELQEHMETHDDICTQAEAMTATGKFKLLEEVEVTFDLDITERPVSFLPDGEPVEKEYEGFTMRITSADYTASTMKIIIEAVFTDEESARQFNDERRLFIALNEEGLLTWDRNNGAWGNNSSEMEARDDGTWVWEFFISHMSLLSLPEYVTVCPSVTTLNLPFESGFSYDSMEGVVLPLR